MDTGDASRHNPWQPWLKESDPEYRLPLSFAIVAAMGLQAYFAVLAWPLIVIELGLLLELVRQNPRKLKGESPRVRRISWILTGGPARQSDDAGAKHCRCFHGCARNCKSSQRFGLT
jgi:hypothetical protein